MTVHNIIKAPDPILNRVCDPVDLTDASLPQFADDLVETMMANKGRGLAAPQIGIAIRMFCMKHGGGVRVMINPTIVRRGRDLACWCPLDQPCHADVLIEIANRPIRGVEG